MCYTLYFALAPVFRSSHFYIEEGRAGSKRAEAGGGGVAGEGGRPALFARVCRAAERRQAVPARPLGVTYRQSLLAEPPPLPPPSVSEPPIRVPSPSESLPCAAAGQPGAGVVAGRGGLRVLGQPLLPHRRGALPPLPAPRPPPSQSAARPPLAASSAAVLPPAKQRASLQRGEGERCKREMHWERMTQHLCQRELEKGREGWTGVGGTGGMDGSPAG